MNPKNTLCLIVDIQERLLPALSGADEMLERCRLLIQGLTALDVPFAVTEQYPKGWATPYPPYRCCCPKARLLSRKPDSRRFYLNSGNLTQKRH